MESGRETSTVCRDEVRALIGDKISAATRKRDRKRKRFSDESDGEEEAHLNVEEKIESKVFLTIIDCFISEFLRREASYDQVFDTFSVLF